MYLVMNIEGKGYVAKFNSKSSYTHDLRIAKVYATAEKADRDRCIENERVVTLESQLFEGGVT